MDKLKDNLPLISVVLLLIGFTKLITFYQFFHVDITSFIDFAEVVQLQFTFFTFGSLFLIIFLMKVFDGIENLISDKEQVKQLITTPRSELEGKYPIANWISKRILPILFGTLSVSTLIISYYAGRKGYNHPFYGDILSVFLILLVFSSYPTRAIAGLKSLGLFKEHHTSLLIGMLSLMLLMVTAAIYSRTSAFNMMTKQPDYEARFILNDSTVVTTQNLIYIGKTKSYVFLYNKDADQAEVIPTSDIKHMYFCPGLVNTKVPKFWRTEYYKGPK